MHQNWIRVLCASVLSVVLGSLTGCGGRDNQVVGDSNGWTLEEYNKAIADEDAKANSAAK